MTPDEWQRARVILETALSRPPAERRQAIVQGCGENSALQREIESLLASYDESSDLESFLRKRQSAGGATPPVDLGTLDQTRTAKDGWQDGLGREWGEPAADLPRWGEFSLLEEIGRGAFGVVYRAWDPALKREIALKVIDVTRLPGLRNDALLREGQMLARISQKNVVTVFRAERIAHQVGLAMEYIKGRTLSNLVAQHGPLSAQEATPIGVALCDALAAVHRGGLVHRDVKASNVMRESGGRIVLMDFGAGREVIREAGSWSHLHGTPVYMPPEVLRGAAATPASDIYSLGVLLFFLVTGRYPLAGAEFAEVLREHERGRRLSLGEVRPDLPASFVALVESALNDDPGARPRSAAAFRRDLSEAVPLAARQRRHDTKQSTGRAVARPASRWSRVGLVQRALLVAGGMLTLAIGLGFLTTLEFNNVMGRSGGFGSESPLGILRWGAGSLLAPVVYLGFVLLLFNVGIFVLRFVARLVPSFGRAAAALRARIRSWAERVGLDDPNDLLRGLSVLGLVVLVAILWNYLPLLKSFVSPIDRAPASDLSVLNTANSTAKWLYRRLLELDLLMLCAGFLAVMRIRRRRTQPISPAAIASVITVAGLVLLFLVGPWRVMFHAKFRQATFGEQPCFVLATQHEEMLLHCPRGTPPRNRIVDANDPRVRANGPIVELFDAYDFPPTTPGR